MQTYVLNLQIVEFGQKKQKTLPILIKT